MSILMVTYIGDAARRFDRDYYNTHHIPLVHQIWRPFGLQRIEVFHPVQVGDVHGIVAMSLCHFADRRGVDRALNAPQSATVAADIASFTDIDPIRTVVTTSDRAL